MSTRDQVFVKQQEQIAAFAFDEAVARVFPDMIQRSVPGYSMVVSMIGLIAARYSRENTNLYDLGCSLGATAIAMGHGVKEKPCCIIAVDSSDAMVSRCRQVVADDIARGGVRVPVEVVCADIRDTVVDNASVAALNFTLQFVPVADRLMLLKTIRDGLCPGGALVLSEKLAFADQQQLILDDLYYDYKRANGYSELEISQKRAALEDVLVPETLSQHRARLIEAGFSRVVPWYQGFHFCSLLAIR